MSVQMVTCGAIATSGVTLLLSLAVVYLMHSEITSLWSELDAEIDKFKLLTNDSWNSMLMLGVGTPSNRHRRQYGGYGASGINAGSTDEKTMKISNKFLLIALQPGKLLAASQNCICVDFGGCPPGPPGPPGKPGIDAPDGLPGVDGFDGMDSVNFMKNSNLIGCIYCLQGPPGVEGKTGPMGKRGMRGAKGAPGVPGRDGNPGMPGPQGLPGPQGPDGKQGRTGRKGDDSEQLISKKERQRDRTNDQNSTVIQLAYHLTDLCTISHEERDAVGRKGPPGEPGAQGPRGNPGRNVYVGPVGQQGMQGIAGFQGAAGADGEPGPAGPPGPPGMDVTYCKCPVRDASDTPSLYG